LHTDDTGFTDAHGFIILLRRTIKRFADKNPIFAEQKKSVFICTIRVLYFKKRKKPRHKMTGLPKID